MNKLFNFILSGSVLFSGLLTSIPTISATEKKDSTILNIATFNIASKNHPDLKEISNQFSEYDIDVAGIQEVDMFNDRNDYDMMEGLRNEEYPYVDFGKGRDYAGGDFGVGIVSKYEFLNTLNIPTEGMGEATKAIERVEFEKDGKRIALYNYHPSYEEQSLRRRQFRKLIEYVNMDETPYKIITGDFNADQSKYEYTMFLDDFYISNGKDGIWFDTFNEVDTSMKVNIVDNIMCTKNIKINNVDMVDNKLSDHNMLYAELELLDKVAPKGEGNIALGQDITTSEKGEGDKEMMVDYDVNTAWTPNGIEQSVTLSLDKVYDFNNVQVDWTKPGTSYTLEISNNGITYEEVADVVSAKECDEINLTHKSGKYVRLNIRKSNLAGIKEFKIIGKPVLAGGQTPIASEVVKNGGFEETESAPTEQMGPSNTYWDVNLWTNDIKPVGWNLQMYNASGNPDLYNGALDKSDKKEGEQSLVIKKDDTSNHSAFFKQLNSPAEPNTTYMVSFWIKTDDLTNDALQLSISQRDSKGKEIPSTNQVWNDLIEQKGEWTQYKKTITTSAKTAQMDFTFKIINPYKGTLRLDGMSVKGSAPIINVDYAKIVGSTEMNVGNTQQLLISELPKNSEPESYIWESTNPEIASVDDNGFVSAKKQGSTIIKIKSKTNSRLYSSMKMNVVVDKTSLNKMIEEAKKIDISKYTEESVKVLQEALAKAERILTNNNATQDDVKIAEKALQKAVEELVERDIVVNKTFLNKVINESKGIDTSKYTEESVKVFKDALAKAEAVSKDDKATQEDVDNAEKSLAEAIKNLVEKEKPSQPVEADKSELKDIIEAVKGVDTGNYTEESVKALKEALSKAESVLTDKDATQEEVDKVTKELTEAYKNLKKKEVEEPETGDTDKEEDKKDDEKENDKDEVKTGVTSPVGAFAATAGLALAGAIIVAKKKREE